MSPGRTFPIKLAEIRRKQRIVTLRFRRFPVSPNTALA
jgi:hypothetical protein